MIEILAVTVGLLAAITILAWVGDRYGILYLIGLVLGAVAGVKIVFG